jgi:hypothetical protein
VTGGVLATLVTYISVSSAEQPGKDRGIRECAAHAGTGGLDRWRVTGMALLLFITKLSASVLQYPRELMPASMRRAACFAWGRIKEGKPPAKASGHSHGSRRPLGRQGSPATGISAEERGLLRKRAEGRSIPLRDCHASYSLRRPGRLVGPMLPVRPATDTAS